MRGASFERPVSVVGQVATGTDIQAQPSDHRLVQQDQTDSQIVWGMILRDHAPQNGRHPVWISYHRLCETSVCM